MRSGAPRCTVTICLHRKLFFILAQTGFHYDKRYKKTDKEFLGGVAVIKKGRTVDKQFELAYWLKKDACKKGYMQEAVRALENMLFSSGAERLVIRNDVDNLNSVKVAQNLGYQLEGIERNGRFSECLQKLTDINVFSKIK